MQSAFDTVLRLSLLVVLLASLGCGSPTPADPKPKGEIKIDPRLKISGSGGGTAGGVQGEVPAK